MENTLRWIHEFLDVILSNFNMAWLLLIVIIVYHKQILDLLGRVTRIGFHDAYVNFRARQLSEDLGNAVKSHDAEDREIPPVGAGGLPGGTLAATSTDSEMMRLLTDNNILIGFYYENGSNATITRMYKFLEAELERRYSVDFTNARQAERTIKERDGEVYRIFRKLKEVYAATLEHDKEDLWKLEDVINYSFLIKIALNKIEI
ncbi:hypothetical protein [Salinicoccus kekensis]|uniref:Uncharacterized protein n=1 Tax=Salinicoccus kekensis TaxID=714307 RepID=A0A285U746_9STAP|nr:hypothetical protein [Salinicoccus kekensis]SOC37659.1 hypothetical protein SAMN05878391_0044 [Salinicoccus kekensis]